MVDADAADAPRGAVPGLSIFPPPFAAGNSDPSSPVLPSPPPRQRCSPCSGGGVREWRKGWPLRSGDLDVRLDRVQVGAIRIRGGSSSSGYCSEGSRGTNPGLPPPTPPPPHPSGCLQRRGRGRLSVRGGHANADSFVTQEVIFNCMHLL